MVLNALAAANVGRSPACIALFHAKSSVSLLTGLLIMPTPKKSLKNPRKKCARSAFMPAVISSNVACGTPAGLSVVCSMYGTTALISATLLTPLP